VVVLAVYMGKSSTGYNFYILNINFGILMIYLFICFNIIGFEIAVIVDVEISFAKVEDISHQPRATGIIAETLVCLFNRSPFVCLFVCLLVCFLAC
jgi:hypothetical protein